MMNQLNIKRVHALPQHVWVLSDSPRVTSKTKTMHVDLRTVVHMEKPYIFAAASPTLLSAVKSPNEAYKELAVPSDFLAEYCRRQAIGVMFVTSVACDVTTRRAFARYTLLKGAGECY